LNEIKPLHMQKSMSYIGGLCSHFPLINPGGMKMGMIVWLFTALFFNANAQYEYDVSKAVYAGDAERFSIGAQEDYPEGLAFNSTGTKMYVVGQNNMVYEYNLGIGFDVSTAVYAGDAERFNLTSTASSPRSIKFNNNGSKMFVVGYSYGEVNEFNLSTNYDVSSASFVQSINVIAQDIAPFGVTFNTNGSKMFVVGFGDNNILEYHLTTNFDISTASYQRRFNYGSQDVLGQSVLFNLDGTKMYVLGAQRDAIFEYNLSVGYDVSTAVFAGNAERFLVSGQDGSPVSMAYNADGTKLFVLGESNDFVNEYSLDNVAPVIAGAVAGQVTNDITTVKPFSTITISDANRDQLSATITLDNAAKGTLSGTGLTHVGGAVYSISSTSVADIQAKLRDLDFTPTANRLSAGNTETTTFTLNISDGLLSDSDNATTVVVSPIAPTVVISSLATSPTNGFDITITFSEDVSNFVVGDITVTNGTAGSFVVTSASIYTAQINPTANGTVAIDIAAGVAQDAGNINNTAATQFTLTADVTAPTLTITSPVADPTNGVFSATFTFTEDVTGLAVGGITLENATASNFTSSSASVYTADITPTSDGTVTIDVAANVAEDAATNGNTAATQFSVEADFTDPTITITSLVADPTKGAFTATFTFSEDVTGFELTDINVDNGTTGSFAATSASVYTAQITPTTDGTVTVDVAANVAEDAATNGNIAATQFSVEADFTDPTITITSLAADPTNGAFTATFTFSEDVTGFDVADITVGNGTTGSFAATSASVYTAQITPTTDGTVTVVVAANVAEDAATNGNIAATQFSTSYDGTDPTVTITSSLSISTKVNPIPIAITFSEEVTDFTLSDLVVGNGSAANFSTSDNIVFTANIIPASDGNITVDIASATAQDLAGSDNKAATTFSIAYDSRVDRIICENITVQLDANGTATIDVGQIDNGSSDSFGIASRSIDITSFNCSHVGDNNVTLTITDNNGNVGTCGAIVTVEDNIAPTVLTQDITVALDVNGQASIIPADIDNGSTDNCGIATLTLDVSSFDIPTTESTTVTLTATDVNGHSAAATAIVTFGKVAQSIVFDPIGDKKVGQDPVILQATQGESGLPVTFSIVTEPSSGVASLVDGTIIIEGSGTVVVTARQAGNDIFQAAKEVSQSFDILSSELFLPTLFTPNNDQANDRFILRGGGNVANIEFRIFDREGNPVFNSQSTPELFQSGWDGTNEGKEQPQGAYVWVIKGTFQDGSPLLINGKDTGIVRLKR
jgi:gliding motility-associated-like protein